VFSLTTVATRTLSSVRNIYQALHGSLTSNGTPNYTGEVSIADAEALVQCGSTSCVNDIPSKIAICNKFTINQSNPDLEGDYSTLKDGADILANESNLVTGIPARRLLQSLKNLASINPSRILSSGSKGYIAGQTEGGMVVQTDNGKGDSALVLKITVAFLALFVFF
jgi:hypothetical protein